MRASQVGIQTPAERLLDMRKILDHHAIKVSCVTGDFDVPSNNDRAPDGLRKITPYLDVAEKLGTDLIRIGMKKEDDIAQPNAHATRPGNGRSASRTNHIRGRFSRPSRALSMS